MATLTSHDELGPGDTGQPRGASGGALLRRLPLGPAFNDPDDVLALQAAAMLELGVSPVRPAVSTVGAVERTR
jgi:hypothetical protein